eukprot:symbB.v1.2.013520.t1/scaffold795.1/size259473/12
MVNYRISPKHLANLEEGADRELPLPGEEPCGQSLRQALRHVSKLLTNFQGEALQQVLIALNSLSELLPLCMCPFPVELLVQLRYVDHQRVYHWLLLDIKSQSWQDVATSDTWPWQGTGEFDDPPAGWEHLQEALSALSQLAVFEEGVHQNPQAFVQRIASSFHFARMNGEAPEEPGDVPKTSSTASEHDVSPDGNKRHSSEVVQGDLNEFLTGDWPEAKYGAKKGQPSWFLAFQLTGSVFPHCFYIVFPISVLALVLKILHIEAVFGEGKQDFVTGFYFLVDGAPWSGFSGFVSFVIVFRLSAAYSTYWSAYTTANAFLGDWSGAAASAVSFCRGSKQSEEDVEVFLHKIIRLFSMLSACALQELSPRKSHQVWGLLTLNSGGIDERSLAMLDGSSQRVDLCYHWIQQVIVDGQNAQVFGVPPPMVSRALAELSSGMGKFGDAKKHATTQFNFPYAQTCKWLLILYSMLMPFMMDYDYDYDYDYKDDDDDDDDYYYYHH